MAAMTDGTPPPFDLPAMDRKKLTADFNGGAQSSDAGLLLLREAESASHPARPGKSGVNCTVTHPDLTACVESGRKPPRRWPTKL